jgi:transposase
MRRMRIPMEIRGQLATRFEVLLPHLNERQQRLALAVEARLLGRGGVRAVAQVAGVSETTVRKGVFELEAGEEPFSPGRVRRPGGGRKSAAQQDPDLVPALLALVEPDERGDPESPLRWTTKSLRHLAAELTRQGHPVSAPTVGRLLRREGFSLQANVKTLEGAQHPDRDAQFRYLNEQVKDHQADGEPVVSVDTKKREQLGRLPWLVGSGVPPASPSRSKTTTSSSPVRTSSRPSRTGSTTSPATPAGSTSASTTTPACSRWNPSAAGGGHAEAGTTRRHHGC